MAKVTNFEQTRKRLGMSVGAFYAIPRDPPSASKLPIFDAAHVRNALARFNQVTGVTPAEKATARRKINAAAKKFGVQVSKNNNLKGGSLMTTTKDVIDKAVELLSGKDKLEGDELAAVRASLKTVQELQDEEKTDEEKKDEEDFDEDEDKDDKDADKEEDKEATAKLSGKLIKRDKELAAKVKAYNELSEKADKATKELSDIKDAEKEVNVKELAEKEVEAGIISKEDVETRIEELKGFEDSMIEQLSKYVENKGVKNKAKRKSAPTDNLKDDNKKDDDLIEIELKGSEVSIKNPSDW